MGRKAEKERINRFRKDVELLKKKYDNMKMAELLGMDPGNLSSYYTGKRKNPGEDFLDKFYTVFGEDLKQLRAEYPIDESGSATAEEPMGRYLNERDAHFQTLKLDNEAFRVNLFKVVANNETLVQTNQKLVDSQLWLLDELHKRGKED